MTRATFAARIRWRSRVLPTWEVDTVHRGFPSAEAAALFANGVGAPAVDALWLDHGVLALELTDGRHAQFEPSEITVWLRPEGAGGLPDIAGFERVMRSSHDLSSEGLDGEFEAKAFRIVIETTPERDVEVRLDVDLRRDVLRVAIVGSPAVEKEQREPPTMFGVVPKA
jgi:hypothetical protein